MACSKFCVLFLLWTVCLIATTGFTAPIQKRSEADEANELSVATLQLVITCSDEPVRAANVYLLRDQWVNSGVTNDLGELEFELASDDPLHILAIADDKSCHLQSVEPKTETNLRIQLKNLATPIKGRIIDNQGKSVTNARLRVQRLNLDNVGVNIPETLDDDRLNSSTNDDGIFRFDGINPAMIGGIKVSGQGLLDAIIDRKDLEEKIVLVAQPARTVRGRVIDRLTKKPITDVAVSSQAGESQSIVDAFGAFELSGLAAFQPNVLVASPSGDQPYLTTVKEIPAEFGFKMEEFKIELEPGVLVHCRIKDFGTDGPATAELFYAPTPDNRQFDFFLSSLRRQGAFPAHKTNSFGEANVVAIPGPGAIVIVAQGYNVDESVKRLTEEQRIMLSQVTGGNDITAVTWIDPKDLNAEVRLDFMISKGRSIRIHVAHDQLVATDRLIVHRASSKSKYGQRVQGIEFVAEQFHPNEKRQILVHATEKRLGGILDVESEALSPVRLAMKPTGSVKGLLVDEDGEIQAGVMIQFELKTEKGYQAVAASVFTDANGRFNQPSLIADLAYRISAVRLANHQQMMNGSPMMDARSQLSEQLVINSEENVDLGRVVFGGSNQPVPRRSFANKAIGRNTLLPSFLRGIVTDSKGTPVTGAMISINSWSNRTGNLKSDLNLETSVLAQSQSDAAGVFQLQVDASLEKKIIQSPDSKQNAAVFVVADKFGAIQIPFQAIADPQNLQIDLPREMILRGTVSASENTAQDPLDKPVRLMIGSPLRVYDNDSIRQIITLLRDGISLNRINDDFSPMFRLDPMAGGLKWNWEAESNKPMRVHGIPLNAIFELTAFTVDGQQTTVTVISRPIRGFEYKPFDDSPETKIMQGSRIKIDLALGSGESK